MGLARVLAPWGWALGFVLLLVRPAGGAELEVVTNDEHILTTITEGVYVIRHKRAAQIGALSGNTTVVVGEREVLVVDAGSAPSIARLDVEQIRRWTDRPIRYLVNTHWHGDHTWGNSVYLDELAGVTVIAHEETARQMRGYLTHFLPSNVTLPTTVREMIATGKNEVGTPLSEEETAYFRANLPHYEARAREFANVRVSAPTLTFVGELEIDLGDRRVRLLHLGRGNTAGDVVVHLPEESVVVAGDLIVYPRPFSLGGFPREWSRTLDSVARLGAATIVPGHGAVLVGEEASLYLALIRDVLATVARVVQEETFRRGNNSRHLEEVAAAVAKHPDIAALRERLAADFPTAVPWIDDELPGFVPSAYREAWGN